MAHSPVERQADAAPAFTQVTRGRSAATASIEGVVIGVVVGISEKGRPLMAYPGNPCETAVEALATVALSGESVGREAALLFEQGDPHRPILVGLIQHHEATRPEAAAPPVTARVDGERHVLSAEQEIVLRCGKASITLTRAGKVVIRGTYVLSRSSGVNRIKGGSIQLN